MGRLRRPQATNQNAQKISRNEPIYERLSAVDGPDEIFWAVRVVVITHWFYLFFVLGATLWHSAIWSLELIMFW